MDNASDNASKPSKLEWLPLILLPVLAAVHFLIAVPDSTLHSLTFFVMLALIPGAVLRLFGKPSWNTHRVCFALGLIAFVLNNPKLRPDANTLRAMLDNWPLVALGFLASFTQPVWGALRMNRLLNDSGVEISRKDGLKLTLVGSFFNIFLPGSTGGDAYRVFDIVKNHHGKLGAAIASISLDRFLGLPALILVVLLGMLLEYDFFRSNRVLSGLVPFIATAAVVCVVFVTYLAFAGKSGRDGGALSEDDEKGDTKKTGWIRRLHGMVASNVKSRATLPLALLYGFLSYLATIASCLCFGVALGVVGVPPLRYFLIVPMAMAINAIPGAPGGVGQGELAMATLLDMAHPGAGNAQTGVMVMLLFRLSNMIIGLAGGLFYASGKSAAPEIEAEAHGD